MGGRGANSSGNKRLNTAKQIVKEIYGYTGEQLVERTAKKILQFNEGEQVFDGDYVNTKNGIEKSQRYLDEWLKELRRNGNR